MIYVTDTHSLIWFLTKSKRLSPTAQEMLSDTISPLIVPAIVHAEIAFLHARGRISLPLATVLAVVANMPNTEVYPFNERVALRLPLSLEMHDAMIVATALDYGEMADERVALVTRDADIAASGLVRVIW